MILDNPITNEKNRLLCWDNHLTIYISVTHSFYLYLITSNSLYNQETLRFGRHYRTQSIIMCLIQRDQNISHAGTRIQSIITNVIINCALPVTNMSLMVLNIHFFLTPSPCTSNLKNLLQIIYIPQQFPMKNILKIVCCSYSPIVCTIENFGNLF